MIYLVLFMATKEAVVHLKMKLSCQEDKYSHFDNAGQNWIIEKS